MIYYLQTAALGPILALQGARARRRVPRLPEPPGARHGSCGEGPPLGLLIAGDSAAAGVGAAEQAQGFAGRLVDGLSRDFHLDWRLEATTGHRTIDTISRLEALPRQRYDTVVTSLGVNDVTGMTRRGQWRRQQSALWALVRERFETERIIVSGLPPMHLFTALPQPLRCHLGRRAGQLNRDLRDMAATDDSVTFVNLRFAEDPALLATDGFHPGPLAHSAWARRIADVIRPTA